MNCISILAQANTAASADVQVVPIDFIWEQITSLSWLQAVLAISFGVVYLLYGWRIFKILVVISFAMLGLFAGIHLGGKAGSQMWGGVIGLAVMAGMSIPLMKWGVSILGAVAGGLLTSGLWYAFELPQMYIWAGGIVGIVAGGMISFIVFRIAVMLFTSLGGSSIVAIGVLALLHLYENNIEPATDNIQVLVFESSWFLPLMLLVPTITGMIIQNKLIKKESKWEL